MHIRYDEKFRNDPTLESSAIVYAEPDALKKLMEGHGHSLNEQSARILMKRGSKILKWGVTFTRDIRHKLPSIDPMVNDKIMMMMMERLRCDLLIIRAKQSPYIIPEKLKSKYYEIYERNCRLFRECSMDGTHHLHLNTPHTVSEAINTFISDSVEQGPILHSKL